VTQDTRRAAEMLIDTLIDSIETGEIHNSLLPVHLTVRESSTCNSAE
jgi:DNA-binding LacI/PurR family transcriptional regulator